MKKLLFAGGSYNSQMKIVASHVISNREIKLNYNRTREETCDNIAQSSNNNVERIQEKQEKQEKQEELEHYFIHSILIYKNTKYYEFNIAIKCEELLENLNNKIQSSEITTYEELQKLIKKYY